MGFKKFFLCVSGIFQWHLLFITHLTYFLIRTSFIWTSTIIPHQPPNTTTPTGNQTIPVVPIPTPVAAPAVAPLKQPTEVK